MILPQKYFDHELPYIKAGDNAILITEDNKQYKAAKEAGIRGYRIEDFINEFIDNTIA